MIKVGHKVPDFTNEAYHNDEIIDLSSVDLKNKWHVLFFYPGDFTFVCPTELGDLADLYGEFQKIGVEVMSVSTDSKWTHKAWHNESDTIKKITYPMIADPTGNMTKDYGVYIDDEGVALRGSFIVNPEGILVAMEVHSDGIGRDIKELLRKVQTAQYVHEHGVVCPAGWQPGDKTLEPGLNLVGVL